jgi:hypothetical protein
MSVLIHAFADQFITIVVMVYSALSLLTMGGAIVAAIVSPIVRLLRRLKLSRQGN